MSRLDEKTNIDNIRMNSRIVRLLSTLEKKVKYCTENCMHCMYRETDISYCWYKMTTNLDNHVKDGTCKHFVDRKEAIKKLNEAEDI